MASVGLIEIDGKIPNLALMKLSAYHKSIGDDVNLIMPSLAENYELIYASKIFSYTPMPALPKRTNIGGSGADIKKKLPDNVDSLCPDYSLYSDMNYSLGYFTRGCVRECPWCIVPEKEGMISAYAFAKDFIRHDKAVLLDNNVLAHQHGINQIEYLIDNKIKTDFNQGLDARLIDSSMAKILSKVRWIRYVRLACDNQRSKKEIENAVKLMRLEGLNNFFVYCLINEDIKEAKDRIDFLTNLNVDVYAQPYRDYSNKNNTTRDMRELAGWCNTVAIRKKMSFESYYKYRNKSEIII